VAEPAFVLLGGGGQLTQTTATSWVLALGTIAIGTTLATSQIGIANDATAPADTLEGAIDLSGGGELSVSAASGFEPVQAGGLFRGLTATVSPTVIGALGGTITLHPVDANASNYAAALPDEVLTITGDVACFAAGTRLLTARGPVAVEHLAIGEEVVTGSGARRPIVWLGHRRIAARRHPRPELVWPIRIRAGAFAPSCPARDLWLSPDHAVSAGGVLIPVKHLVNGTTIVQVEREDITYWHVELDSHDIVLAEGLPCESYLDTGNRHAFANSGSLVQMHPDFRRHPDHDHCTWEAFGYAPLIVTGPELDRVREQLRRRSATDRSEYVPRAVARSG